MLKYNIKTALRFLKHNKVFSGINALGLSIALAASFIIFLYVINELSYNSCHKNIKRIFRVLNYYKDFNMTMSGTPYILSSALKEEFPQIEKAIRVQNIIGLKLKLNDEYIDVSKAVATDSEVFDIFTLTLSKGVSNKNLLDDQNAIVLSAELATKLFPDQDPVGKEIIGLIDNEEHVFVVKGVFENIPENSTFRAQCLLNSKWTIEPINKSFGITNAELSWDMDFWTTWVLLSKDFNTKLLENQLMTFEIKYISKNPHNRYSLQNLSKVYLESNEVMNTGIKGDINNIRLFLAIALVILLVAAINYIILATAVSSNRIKEIGIRKTFGASKRKIGNHLLSESILLTVLVLPISLIIMLIAMPYAGKLFQTQLHIIRSNIFVYFSVYLALTLLIGFVSGIYTSFYLSRLEVINILKNTLQYGKRKQVFRSSLIAVQLIIFCSFVSGTLIIRSQYQFALNKDIGYYSKNILLIELGQDFKGYPTYINSIKSNPDIIQAAGVMQGLPLLGSMTMSYPNFQDKELKVNVEGMSIDYNFLETMGISVIKGRDFSEEFGSDLTQSCILNESAVKRLGITDPIGLMLRGQTIIGVVKDFNLHSIHSDIPPLKIGLTDKFINQIVVHYKPGTLNNILPMLESGWKKSDPKGPFEYRDIEDLIRNLYSSEKNLNTVISIFALFTIVIAMFGLFGLTLFITKTRTKEIGVKKVLGSSEKSILYSFLFENLILVIIATLLSVPVTLHFMMKWLNNFSYKVDINWWIFTIAFIIAAIVVLLTVSFHSYKASRINPVDALKYE